MTKEELLRAFGANVKALRKAKNISQKTLADDVGRTPHAIQRLEAGLVDPSYNYLCELACGLGIVVEKLLDMDCDGSLALWHDPVMHLS